MTQKQVCHHIKVFTQRQILKHRGNTVFQRLAGAIEGDGVAVKLNGAGGRLVDAGEDLHQRGFARAVVADQRDYLAGVDF